MPAAWASPAGNARTAARVATAGQGAGTLDIAGWNGATGETALATAGSPAVVVEAIVLVQPVNLEALLDRPGDGVREARQPSTRGINRTMRIVQPAGPKTTP